MNIFKTIVNAVSAGYHWLVLFVFAMVGAFQAVTPSLDSINSLFLRCFVAFGWNLLFGCLSVGLFRLLSSEKVNRYKGFTIGSYTIPYAALACATFAVVSSILK